MNTETFSRNLFLGREICHYLAFHMSIIYQVPVEDIQASCKKFYFLVHCLAALDRRINVNVTSGYKSPK